MSMKTCVSWHQGRREEYSWNHFCNRALAIPNHTNKISNYTESKWTPRTMISQMALSANITSTEGKCDRSGSDLNLQQVKEFISGTQRHDPVSTWVSLGKEFLQLQSPCSLPGPPHSSPPFCPTLIPPTANLVWALPGPSNSFHNFFFFF